MISQKPISVKLDYGIIERLTLEAGAEGRPKNRVINDALELYCDIMDCHLSMLAGSMPYATYTATARQMIEAIYKRAYRK